MIPYSRGPQETIPSNSVKIIGIGGAGANMLERIALDGVDGAELLALNTDIRTLGSCLAQEKIQLGINLTKGLGTGGDPELGHQAVLEAENTIRESIKGRRIVFICTGLGGGTGSGAAPIVTRIAREEGAFVVVFATMPFAFEGRRRRDQAETALNELAVLSNALVTFDNNRMGELVLAKQGVHEAFAAADHMICESIKAVIRLVVRPGLINVGLDDLMSALRTNRSRCLFGSGIASGSDRAIKALRNSLSSPLLDQGALLKDARSVLVHLCGGESLTLFEIELLMQRLQKFVPESAHILFGAAVDPAMGDSLSLTLISALPEDALASAPRESLSRATQDTPLLDPSQGFTPAAKAAEPEKPEPAPSPQPEPEPVVEYMVAPVQEAPAVSEPEPVVEHIETPVQETPAISGPEPEQETTFGFDVPALVQPEETPTPVASPARHPEPAPAESNPLNLFADEHPLAEPEVSEEPAPVLSQPEEPVLISDPTPEAAAPEEIVVRDEEEKPVSQSGVTIAEFVSPETERQEVELATHPDPKPPVDLGELDDLDEIGQQDHPGSLIPRRRPEGVAPWNPAKGLKDSLPAVPAPAPEPETPKLKLGVKNTTPQSELSFDSTPRGRFEGESPNVFEGEDLDLPPFLRKKR